MAKSERMELGDDILRTL